MLLLSGASYKISTQNRGDVYFQNALILKNLQLTQAFYYPQIPLNKECYLKLTVRSNVWVSDSHFGHFSLFSYKDVVSWWRGMPGVGVIMYKNEFFHTPKTTVGLNGIYRVYYGNPSIYVNMYNEKTSYFSCDFEVFYN